VKAAAALVSWGSVFNRKDRNRFRSCLSRDEDTYSTIATSNGATAYANYVKAGKLNYVRVFGAGHMINEAKPAEAKHLFETWVFHPENFQECVLPN